MVKEIQTIDDFYKCTGFGDKSAGLVVIDFSASWCEPCKKMLPFFEKLAAEIPSVGFYKINIENSEMEKIVQICQVSSLPSFCFFRGGEYMTKMVGANRDKLVDLIKQYLPRQEERSN
jgi:thioredoxin 1